MAKETKTVKERRPTDRYQTGRRSCGHSLWGRGEEREREREREGESEGGGGRENITNFIITKIIMLTYFLAQR